MKNLIDKKIFVITSVFVISATVIMCSKPADKLNSVTEEIQTARAGTKNCFTVCDPTKNPDLRIVTNAGDQPQVDGVVDSSTYFWQSYHVRSHPVHLTQNYVTPETYAIRYGWETGEVVNRVQLQCLIENIAPFDSTCVNDWVFNESQGYLSPLNNIFFDGLFEFESFEKIGNHWKKLYTDFKKEFFPNAIPTREYVFNTDFCYYSTRAIQAQTGDFYYNYFRFPNHDGIYKLVITFNPQVKGCRAVKETNYENNQVTVILEIKEGQIIILEA